MNPGELKYKIDIQKYVGVDNEVGEQVKQWQSYKKVWAKFLKPSIKSDLATMAEKKVSSISQPFAIRFRKDIDTTMRVVYDGNNYNIDHVDNNTKRNVETHLYCTLIEEGPYDE